MVLPIIKNSFLTGNNIIHW
uniref:Uncharacterized protein n=1 Tax=Arundo donax TaxID=35708 RepID=A0A0A9A8X0_ARUDO